MVSVRWSSSVHMASVRWSSSVHMASGRWFSRVGLDSSVQVDSVQMYPAPLYCAKNIKIFWPSDHVSYFLAQRSYFLILAQLTSKNLAQFFGNQKYS